MQLKLSTRFHALKARTAHVSGGPFDPAMLSLGLLNSVLILGAGFVACQEENKAKVACPQLKEKQ
jgi:hypothetical protein